MNSLSTATSIWVSPWTWTVTDSSYRSFAGRTSSTSSTIARRIRQVAAAAREKKLTADDLTGATFTITNPGPYGTLMTGAIINQPQVAILATDGVTRRPVVVTGPDGEESITIHSVGLLALTFDHRAIDGATAARFLAHVDAQLNGRDWFHE